MCFEAIPAFEFLILRGMTEMFSLCPMAKRFETKREQLENPVFETSVFNKTMPKGQPKNKGSLEVSSSQSNKLKLIIFS